jgi:hypothetical protein
MTYLINALALPILVSLVMGMIVGWWTLSRDGADSRGGWLPFGLLVFAVGCYAAASQVVAGRHGLWLETGLVLFAAYLAGCTIGCVLRQLLAGVDLGGTPGLALAGPAGALAVPSAPVVAAPVVKAGPDDLALIWGVGDKLAQTLNGMGIHRFEQIAQWTDADISRFEGHSPEFRGRVARDQWIEQCQRLASGWRPESAVGQRLVRD